MCVEYFMKNLLCFLVVFPFAVFAAAPSPLPTVGTIERLDPAVRRD
jgi:hypothetical protein